MRFFGWNNIPKKVAIFDHLNGVRVDGRRMPYMPGEQLVRSAALGSKVVESGRGGRVLMAGWPPWWGSWGLCKGKPLTNATDTENKAENNL